MTLLLFFSGQSDPRSRLAYYRAARGPARGLHVATYNAARTEVIDVSHNPANIGVRWALPGGLQRFEFTVKTASRFEAYERYRAHVGGGFALWDDFFDRPICDGWYYEVMPDGRYVHYAGAGAWKRHTDEYHTTNPAAPTTDTDVYLKTVLTASVPAVNSDQSNIAATSTDMGAVWEVDPEVGTQPDRIVTDILGMGTSTAGKILDYWTVSYPSPGVLPELPLAYLAPRATSGTPEWLARRKNVVRLEIGRNIWSLRNDIDIKYGQTTTLSADANGGATSISTAASIAAEYEIEIWLDSGRKHRTVVDSVSGGGPYTVNLVTALPNTGTNPTASSGNVVQVTSPLSTDTSSDSTSQSDYWTREYKETRAQYDATAAGQLGDTLLDFYKDPAQRAAFVIGGNVQDEYRASWPIWRMLINPGYITVPDIFPAVSLFNGALDAKRRFKIVALDYDHASRQMRVTPDTLDGDSRLDVVLQQLGAQVGQMVQRM